MRYSTSKYTHCIGKFYPGKTVTISLVDLETLLPVSLISDVCVPIPSNPAYYVWNAIENIEATEISSVEKEYIYVMTDGTTEFPGKIVVGGYGDLSGDLNELIRIIYKVETGRWKINKNSFQMIFYDDDDETPLLTFDLKDERGNKSYLNVFERTK